MKARLQLLIFAAFCVVLSATEPATSTWTGSTDDSFTTPANWSNGVPTASTLAAFVPPSRPMINLTASTAVLGLSFENTETYQYPSYFFQSTNAAGSLAIGSSGIVVEGLLAPTSWIAFDSSLPVSLAGAQVWDIGTNASLQADGAITGPGGFTKIGAGNLYFNGATDGLVGAVSILGGTLHLGADSAFHSTTSISVDAGGTLASSSSAEAGTTVNASSVLLAKDATLGGGAWNSGMNKLVFSGTVTAKGTDAFPAEGRLVLAEDSQSYFEGSFNGYTPDMAVTFTGEGVAVLKGITSQVASFTADGAGLVINTSSALPSGSLLATNDGYVGMAAGFANDASVFLARITSPANFAGTLGFDSDPAGAPNAFLGAINLTNFSNAGFRGLGSASHATIDGTATITLPTGATEYRFGGGGGRLTVGPSLTGAVGLKVSSPADKPLTLVLIGTNNTFSGDISVDHSYLVLDSSGALPTGSTIALGPSGYVSATAETGILPNTLLGKISAYDSTSIVGFDSSQPASTAREVSDAITLSSANGPYLGTTTFNGTGLTLSGTISGPTDTTLKLAGVNNGTLTVTSNLAAANNIKSLVVGHPDPEMGNRGTVVLSGANTYTGDTRLQSGMLQLGSSSAADGLSGPLGAATGALTVATSTESTPKNGAMLASTTPGISLLNDIILEANAYLMVSSPVDNGLTLKGDFSGDATTTLEFFGNDPAAHSIVLLGSSADFLGKIQVHDVTLDVGTADGLVSDSLFLLNGATVNFTSAVTTPTIGSLGGYSGTTLNFGASNATLTINQVRDNKYDGAFLGSGLSLVKNGAAALWLNQPSSAFSGELTVNDGTLGFIGIGTYSTGNAYLGGAAGQHGAVRVLPGSTWAASGYIKLGAAGNSSGGLEIFDGDVTASALHIGYAYGSGGDVQVTGPGASLTVGELAIAAGEAASGTLTITDGASVVVNGAATLAGSSAQLNIGNGTRVGATAGSFSATDGLINDGSLNFDHSTAITFDTVISGSGLIDKFGIGALTLSGHNASFTGDLRIAAGSVTFAENDSLGTSSLTLGQCESSTAAVATFASDAPQIGTLASGGSGSYEIRLKAGSTLTINQSSDGIYSGAFIPAAESVANLRKIGTGVLTLTGNSQLGGNVTVDQGGLSLEAGSTFGTASLYLGAAAASSGMLEVSDGADWINSGELKIGYFADTTGQVTVTGAGSTLSTGTLRLGNGTSASSLTVTDAGQVSVSGTASVNAYSLLYIGCGSVAGSFSASSLALAGNSELSFDHTGPVTFATPLTGSGAVSKSGIGTLTLSGASPDFAGSIYIGDYGLVVVTDTIGATATPASVSIGGYATLQIGTGGAGGLIVGSIANSGNLVVNRSGAIALGGISGMGRLDLAGPGTLTLSGTNSYEGDTFIGNESASGILADAAANAFSPNSNVFLYGGTLQVNHNETIGALGDLTINDIKSGGSVVLASGAVLTIANAGSVFSGTISGPGGLAIGAGAVETLAWNNSYEGGTTINTGGKLIATHASALGASTSTVTLAGGELVVSGVAIANPIAFSGAGQKLLGGNGTFSSAITLADGAGVAPGQSVGTLTFTNGLTWGAGGVYELEVQDPNASPGIGYDTLAVTGALTFSATTGAPFSIYLKSLTSGGAAGNVANFIATNSYQWQVASATSLVGFENLNLSTAPVLSGGFTNDLLGGSFFLTATETAVFLNFAPVPEPSTWALLITGLAIVGLGALRRRQRR